MLRDLVKFDTFEKKLIVGLLFTILFLAILYMYFVNKTVLNVVERRSIDNNIGELSTRVGDMVLVYMDTKGKITGEHAETLGFREFKDVTYVSRSQYAVNALNDL